MFCGCCFCQIHRKKSLSFNVLTPFCGFVDVVDLIDTAHAGAGARACPRTRDAHARRVGARATRACVLACACACARLRACVPAVDCFFGEELYADFPRVRV